MANLQVFNYEDRNVRTVIKDGEPWFIAKDVCDILGIKNSRDAMTRLDEDEKADVVLNDGRQNRAMTIINEPGLYNLILRSDKAEAKTFKRWITHEVLPAIRKTGVYDQNKKSCSSMADWLLESAMFMKKLEEDQKRQQEELEEISHSQRLIQGKVDILNDKEFTIMGYANMNNLSVDNSVANSLGRKAASLSRKKGYYIGVATHPVFGRVNTYHVDILDEVFDQAYSSLSVM